MGPSNHRASDRSSQYVRLAVAAARRARRGPRWTRPFGLLLLVVAVATALGADLPLPWRTGRVPSAENGSGTAPRGLSPRGTIPLAPPSFAWRWDGPVARWTLVVRDEEQREIARLADLDTMAVSSVASLPVEAGRQLHWHVEAEVAGARVRSAPLAFVFSREERPMAPR